jgi:predicted RNase H-like nuclease
VEDAVWSDTLTEAREVHQELDYGVQNQAWSLVSRIRELDNFIEKTEEADELIHETHPEVCFAALGNREPVEMKKDDEKAIEDRLEVLDRHLEKHDTIQSATEWYLNGADSLNKYTKPGYAPVVSEDDILDAWLRRSPRGKATYLVFLLEMRWKIDLK